MSMSATRPAPGKGMPTRKFRWLCELLEDSKPCTRLTDWEENFLSDQRARLAQYGDRIFLSEGQIEKLKQIEQKVHAT